MTKPSAVIFPVFVAAVLFIIGDLSSKNKNVWFAMGWVFIVVALYFATVILIERQVIEKIVEGLTRLMYHDVAIAYAIARMDGDQLAAFSARYIMEAQRSIIRQDGVELDPDWVITFLQKAQAFYPQYPSYRDHKSGDKLRRDNIVEEAKQRALRNYLRQTGRIQSHTGENDTWINGHDPNNTLEALGYD